MTPGRVNMLVEQRNNFHWQWQHTGQDRMTRAEWQPSASMAVLRRRADALAAIRHFFFRLNVLEVDTPVLARASVTDPHIKSLKLRTSPVGEEGPPWYLQTSPEFAMKRLIAAGSGDIYQISRAFRQGELGRLHNPEFTMLEWYRLGFDHHTLMNEVSELLGVLGIADRFEKITYREAFERYANVDPHSASMSMLVQCACDFGLGHDMRDCLTERDQWLDLLMSRVVSPNLGEAVPTFIFDFPASQAALACIGSHGLAERFELFLRGVELANGYHELTDAEELLSRFGRDNNLRRRFGLDEVVVDANLLAAMRSGLPRCAGVAVGIDRLLMLQMNLDSVASVMAFDGERI